MPFCTVQDKVKAAATHDALCPFMNVKITPGFYTKGTGTPILTHT